MKAPPPFPAKPSSKSKTTVFSKQRKSSSSPTRSTRVPPSLSAAFSAPRRSDQQLPAVATTTHRSQPPASASNALDRINEVERGSSFLPGKGKEGVLWLLWPSPVASLPRGPPMRGTFSCLCRLSEFCTRRARTIRRGALAILLCLSGEPLDCFAQGGQRGGWCSRAMRPIVRANTKQ